jgi:hypothetical protein
MSTKQAQYLVLAILATVIGGLIVNAVIQRYPRL